MISATTWRQAIWLLFNAALLYSSNCKIIYPLIHAIEETSTVQVSYNDGGTNRFFAQILTFRYPNIDC